MSISRIALIAAVARNGVIGRGGALPWRLSADLQRFRALTMGHHIIMGRKTYDSLGRALPGRISVIITRAKNFLPPGCEVVASLADALRVARHDDEVFVIGGAQIFAQALPLAQRLYLTRVHADVDGDVYFPPLDWRQWREVSREAHAADQRNDFAFDFAVFDRVVA